MTTAKSRMDALEIELVRRSAVIKMMTVSLVITGLALALLVVSSFERGYVVVGHAIDGCVNEEVYAVHSSWWGLRTRSTQIRWVTPTRDRERGIEFKDWCYQASPGEWVPRF